MFDMPHNSDRPNYPFHPSPARSLVVIALMVLIAAADFMTEYVNLPILYTIPAMLYVRAGTSRQRWLLAGAVFLLAPLGLMFTFTGPGVCRPHDIEEYRIFNRTMALVLVMAITAAGGFLQTVRERLPGRSDDPSDPDQVQYYQMIRAVEQFTMIVVSSGCALVILAMDMGSSGAFNASILYGVPLLLLLSARSSRILWTALPVMIILVWVGFASGLREIPDWLAIHGQLNRVMTSGALFVITIIGHMWLLSLRKAREW